MIKCKTIGQLEIAKINPILQSDKDVKNNDFITDNGVLYLIANDFAGDEAHQDDVTIPAGEYLNGYEVDVWANQNLLADEKHIAYKSGQTYDNITPGTTILTVNKDGKLEITTSAPTSGVYFKVENKCRLTDKAVDVKVVVATGATTANTASAKSN